VKGRASILSFSCQKKEEGRNWKKKKKMCNHNLVLPRRKKKGAASSEPSLGGEEKEGREATQRGAPVGVFLFDHHQQGGGQHLQAFPPTWKKMAKVAS